MSAVVCNARIESAHLQFDRGVFLTVWLHLDFGDSTQQGFGGFVLGGNPYATMAANKHSEQPNLAGEFIGQVMAIAEVKRFDDLPGKIIRVRKEDKFAQISAIGHPTKDRWFNPSGQLPQMVKP